MKKEKLVTNSMVNSVDNMGGLDKRSLWKGFTLPLNAQKVT